MSVLRRLENTGFYFGWTGLGVKAGEQTAALEWNTQLSRGQQDSLLGGMEPRISTARSKHFAGRGFVQMVQSFLSSVPLPPNRTTVKQELLPKHDSVCGVCSYHYL